MKLRLKDHESYTRWNRMKDRCYNKNCKAFERYGGRGIVMCKEWKNSSRTFLEYLDEHLGPCPEGCSLDRVDNDKGYIPGNLRWASAKEQAANRRPPPQGKGYTFNKRDRKWLGQWSINGQVTYYGVFKTEEEAQERARATCRGAYLY